jgi:hypothetical protein
MENLVLNETEDTPSVILDIDNKEYVIEGRSLPEDAMSFYLPIINWLKEFKKTDVDNMVFNFKLDYFNTASAKQVSKLMLTLQDLSEKKDVKIKWHFFIEDTDIRSSGARFMKLISTDIELVPYYDD